MKNIEIKLNYPHSIEAIDHTDNQHILITRDASQFSIDDADACTVMSCLIGDEEPQKGRCMWGDSFMHIQKLFGGTAF